MTDGWFIDTWSPRDGAAFASLRRERNQDSWLRETTRTVSVRPPSWEVVDVRTPTALRAERFAFQVGLYQGATEIRFDSLDELIEIVRRAYVAGGGDSFPGPTPLDDEPPTLDTGEPEPGFVTLIQRMIAKANAVRQPGRGREFRFATRATSGDVVDAFLADAVGHTLPDVVTTVASSVARNFAKRVFGGPLNRRFRASLFEWLQLMVGGGIMDPHLVSHIGDEGYNLAAHHFEWRHSTWWLPSAVAKTSPELSYHVPMPAMGFRRKSTERLIDGLLYMLASSRRWTGFQSMPELAAMVLIACTILAPHGGPWAYYLDPMDRRRELVKSALAWIFEQLPAPLSNTAAEDAIHKYAQVATLAV